MTRRPSFTKAKIQRAIDGAKAAGMKITRCEILPDGRIVLSEAEEAAPLSDGYAEWKRKREDRAQRPS